MDEKENSFLIMINDDKISKMFIELVFIRVQLL